VASAAIARPKDRRRSMSGRAGCGLCGTESLSQVLRELPALPVPTEGPLLQRQAISHAVAQFRGWQTLQRATGAVHAAAWSSQPMARCAACAKAWAATTRWTS
jgi:FdhD protein